MDLKVGVLGTLLSVAVGGGLYGLYLNYGSRAAFTGVTANELLQQCGILQAESHPESEDLREWLAAAKAQRPEIFAVNTIVGAAASPKGAGAKVATEVDGAFGLCAQSLQQKLAELEPPHGS